VKYELYIIFNLKFRTEFLSLRSCLWSLILRCCYHAYVLYEQVNFSTNLFFNTCLYVQYFVHWLNESVPGRSCTYYSCLAISSLFGYFYILILMFSYLLNCCELRPICKKYAIYVIKLLNELLFHLSPKKLLYGVRCICQCFKSEPILRHREIIISRGEFLERSPGLGVLDESDESQFQRGDRQTLWYFKYICTLWLGG